MFMVSFCFQKRCLPVGILIGWYKLSVPNHFLVIRLLAKSRLGISFCTSGVDETSYISLVGKRLLILISKEKVVRRKKLHEFNILVERT